MPSNLATDTDHMRFAGPAQPKPIPDTPTHCNRGCGTELEPLRRYAGVCRTCILAGHKPKAAFAKPRSVWKVVQRYRKKCRDGYSRPHVRIECSCGAQRRMREEAWRRHRPQHCNRCRLGLVDSNGFEAERAR